MNAVRSTETNVMKLDLGNTIDCMEVRKGHHSNLVLLSHEYVLVVDRDVEVRPGVPFIKLAKLCSGSEQAYDEWLRLVGKMCKKECTSKYFDNPVPSEHLSNGKFPDWSKDVIADIAKTAVKAVKD